MPYANPDDRRANDRAHLAEHRERDRESKRNHYLANREMYLAKFRLRAKEKSSEAVARAAAWAEANPERSRASKRAWAERNQSAVRAKERLRRIRRVSAYVEAVEPLILLERDDGVCGICGEDVDPLRFHVDHVIPLSRGGVHSYANTQPTHPLCNQRKGARILV